jgi:hypothetical protein
MSCWQILGRCIASPPPADWRERLIARLGSRPRRLGSWCEQGLYGALECLADAGENTLPPAAQLSVATRHGPDSALLGALQTAAEDGLPMPMGFLQSQPGQLLAHFSACTHWQGDARMLASRDPLDALKLACRTSAADDLLLGWLDEGERDAASIWLRLGRGKASPTQSLALPDSLEALADPEFRRLIV